MEEDTDGGCEREEEDCRLNRVTSRFFNEVWIILLITIITSLAVLFGAAVRESVERTILSLLRWNLGGELMDNPSKPLSFYWIFAIFYLAIFVLVIVLLRFILMGGDHQPPGRRK